MRTLSNTTESEVTIKVPQPESGIIFMQEVMNSLGLTKQEVMIKIKEGQFPRPVEINGREIGFPRLEVDRIHMALKNDATLKEVAELVFVLQQKRIRQSPVSEI